MAYKLFAVLTVSVVVFGVAAAAQWRTPWTYDGPRGAAHWVELDPEFAACGGQAQSPVDIGATERADLPPLRFDFRSAPLKYLINNGKTIRVNYHDPAGAGSFLTVGSIRYHLTQFHFHRPSEESVHGKTSEMAAHFMFDSADGHVAGVAVLLAAGRPNPTVQTLWNHMPMTEGRETPIPGVEIDPAGLLPQDTSYYVYQGSLTAPPCTEGVTWFVLKTPVEVSRAQIAQFAKLYPHDVRPVQPLNGRIVKESR